MQWTYRGFTSDAKGSLPRLSYTPVRHGSRQLLIRWTAEIDTVLMGSSSDAIEARIAEFQRECSVDGGDFVYQFPDSTESVQTVRSASAIGGLRVIRAPSYTQPQPGEHSIFRNASVAFEAFLPISGLGNGFRLELNESVTVDNPDAAPAVQYIELIRRRAVRVQPRQFGMAQAAQSGHVITYGRPALISELPGPKWPQNLLPDIGRRVYNWPEPIRIDGIPVAFRTDWRYQFHFNDRISGDMLPQYV